MIYALYDAGEISAYSRDIDRLKQYAEEYALRYDHEQVEWRIQDRRTIGKLGRFNYAFEIIPITLLEG